MKVKTILFITYFVLAFCVTFYTFSPTEKYVKVQVELSESSSYDNKTPVSLLMYELIEKYSTMYGVPKYIAYNVSYRETRYQGPFHWNYNPHQESCVGAVGPMQVLTSTCNWVNKSHYTKLQVRDNLELNIKTSMKLLGSLYKRYGNWTVVCGWYNTGKPIINEYARYCGSNKDYKSKWIKLQARL
jgi:soluble lytic murein transglycosylase-like protein